MAAKELPAVECKELLSSGATYLDVRTPEEFQEGHHDGATNIPIMFKKSGSMVPNASFVDSVTDAFQDKDMAFVVGCKSGRRSAMAIEAMKTAGYTNLTNMTGGYDGWLAAGL